MSMMTIIILMILKMRYEFIRSVCIILNSTTVFAYSVSSDETNPNKVIMGLAQMEILRKSIKKCKSISSVTFSNNTSQLFAMYYSFRFNPQFSNYAMVMIRTCSNYVNHNQAYFACTSLFDPTNHKLPFHFEHI